MFLCYHSVDFLVGLQEHLASLQMDFVPRAVFVILEEHSLFSLNLSVVLASVIVY